MTTPTQALNKIQREPGYFLRWYQISIAGDPNPSALVQYCIRTQEGYRNERPGRHLSFITHNIRTFAIAPVGAVGHGTDAVNFQAHSIQMVPEGGVAFGAINGYLLPPAPGVTLMVTGQLSGCAFCILDTGAGILCAHIRPNPGNAVALKNNLTANGHFAGHGGAAITVFGSHGGAGGYGYNHDAERITIIGVFRGGAWELYAQAWDPGNKHIHWSDQIF